ncbi:molecular chaperone TorD family protein [bacterium]|nr:molecular chaperone TorD family protein [bacterium]
MATTAIAAQDLLGSASFYRFLAHLFLKEPPEELRDLAHGDQGERLRAMGYHLLEGLEDRTPEAQAEALAVEYCRLFIGPGRHLSPHEAILRGEQRHWGLSTVLVNEAYAKAGFEMAAEAREMPDHVGVELAFIATLCEREAELAESGAVDLAERTRRARKQFLTEHLAVWLPILSSEVAKRAELSFYPVLARLVTHWVTAEESGTGWFGEPANG